MCYNEMSFPVCPGLPHNYNNSVERVLKSSRALRGYGFSLVVLLLVVPWTAAPHAQECTRISAPVLALSTVYDEIQIAGSASVYLDPDGGAEYNEVVAA